MSFIEKWMIKMVRSPTGDFRDWDAISAWVAAIATELQATGPVPDTGSD